MSADSEKLDEELLGRVGGESVARIEPAGEPCEPVNEPGDHRDAAADQAGERDAVTQLRGHEATNFEKAQSTYEHVKQTAVAKKDAAKAFAYGKTPDKLKHPTDLQVRFRTGAV